MTDQLNSCMIKLSFQETDWRHKVMEEIICKCKQVSRHDVESALHQLKDFSDVLKAFDEVQKITHCSTGCGGCHDKIMDAISEIMMH